MGTKKCRYALALASVFSVAGVAAAADPAVIADAVSKLEADHDQATAAVYALQSGGERAAKQIHSAWPTLSLLGQRRALVAVSRLAERHDVAVDTLIEAARSEDGDTRDRGFDGLRRAGPRGLQGFVTLLADPRVGDRAAALLARTDPELAIEPLLAAMGEPKGSGRPALRAALATAVRRSNDGANTLLLGWLAEDPGAPAVASAALGLVAQEAQRKVLTSFVEYAASKSTELPSIWRLLKASAAAGSSTQIDGWVRGRLDDAEHWMLRQAAVEAITARGHREDARGSLKDPYPRVRASAATALSGDEATLLERATLARRDTWPMVRAEAVRSLRSESEALSVLVAAVDDSMSQVRAAAIEVLTIASHDQGWDRVHWRLRTRDEWPQVTAAAIDYVVAHCRSDAAEALFLVVMRAAPSNALTEDLNNAARAIEALRSLGSPEAIATVEQLRSTEGVPPTLKMALERPLGGDAGCAQAPR